MKLGLLGRTLLHSLSPQIHAEVFRRLKLDGSYDLIEKEPEDVAGFLTAAKPEYDGCNVTIPYKEKVIPYLKEITPEAANIGAVNTLFFTPEGLKGYNTDYIGFRRTLAHADIKVTGEAVTVLGNGGAAKAVLQALVDEKAASITIVARSEEKARTSLAHFLKNNPDTRIVNYSELDKVTTGGVIVNTTPVGMFPKVGVSAVPADFTAQYGAAVDLIYNPAETQFLKDARLAGAKTCNGLYMLVAQAIASEEIWQGRELDPQLVPDIMKILEAGTHA